ncbi:helix-turn-helix domain-containing protein [Flavicella marina]|uniref:helix-turn-helix domain-containing protein n=1 Tax=Flavicella marina TaxID=1475951 RepID=UPI001263EEBA|nr:AraC family transcriptional regulator [Flavicella marina]
MKFTGTTNEYLHLEEITSNNCKILKEVVESSLTVLWFQSNQNELKIDGIKYSFDKNQILYLTEFHKIEVLSIGEIRFLRFNRPFYCILDHDVEVSCKGALFFGASRLPLITLDTKELEKFETLWRMFEIEMDANDSLQIDMLQMMLKRYLILGTRIYKQQEKYPKDESLSDLVREFNFLVEAHFKEKHTVAEYAELLHKSPKTLANIFSKMGAKSPLRFIHDRKLLEARRLLIYTDYSIKEITFELGFSDIQSFSRFFKKYETVSPSEFKEKHLLGKIANS